ncbi:hypothetical protein QQS21_001885 [Conoideocrella luteorostrata]|uniref:Glyoxalase family protein n=1 Tax=Conoideocrella luteorostrata TaxID=1105319 RepID=A0AAJ0CZ56_9HYPO|nr:hypothetical protein QQS21_001885 [Conoideocrella luteorostrata]
MEVPRTELPFVEVSHLPSSTSYFASILQPLGLRYIESRATAGLTKLSVIFGSAASPVLQLRQVSSANQVLRTSRLLLTAPSRSAVTRFYERGTQANPYSPVQIGQSFSKDTRYNLGSLRAAVVDMDGNRIEVVYPDPRLSPEMIQSDVPFAHKANPAKYDGTIILDWNFSDFASLNSPLKEPHLEQLKRQPTSHSFDSDCKPQQRTTSVIPNSAEAAANIPKLEACSANDSNKLFSTINTSTVVGAFLGIVAGAALTYGMMAGHTDDQASYRQSSTPISSPHNTQLCRKSPCKDKGAEDLNASIKMFSAQATDFKASLDQQMSSRNNDARPRMPGRDHSSHFHSSNQYHDKDTSQDSQRSLMNRKLCLEDSWGPGNESSRLDAPAKPSRSYSERPVIDETRISERNNQSSARAPLSACRASILEPASTVLSQLQTPVFDIDRETYVSARSHPSSDAFSPRSYGNHSLWSTSLECTDPQNIVSTVSHMHISDSVASSRRSAQHIPLPASSAGSHMSARHTPLPESTISSSRADWDNDIDSIAPSDSISCVGMAGTMNHAQPGTVMKRA